MVVAQLVSAPAGSGSRSSGGRAGGDTSGVTRVLDAGTVYGLYPLRRWVEGPFRRARGRGGTISLHRAPEGARFSYLKSPDLGFFLCGRRFSPGPDLGALARPLLRCRGLFERRKLSSMGVVIGLRMVVTGSSVSSTCAPCVTPVCPVCVPAPPVYFYRYCTSVSFYRSTPGLRLFLRLLSWSRIRPSRVRSRAGVSLGLGGWL